MRTGCIVISVKRLLTATDVEVDAGVAAIVLGADR